MSYYFLLSKYINFYCSRVHFLLSKCVPLHFTVQAFLYFYCPNVSHYTSPFKCFIIFTVQMCPVILHCSSVSLFLLSKCVSLHFSSSFLYFYCANVSHYTSLFKCFFIFTVQMCLITLHCSSVSLFLLSKCVPLHFTVQAFFIFTVKNVSHYTSLFKCFFIFTVQMCLITLHCSSVSLFLLSKCVFVCLFDLGLTSLSIIF